MDDGALEVARRLTPDVVRVTGSFSADEGEAYYVDLARGIYTLVYQDIFDGTPDPVTRMSYSYAEAAADLPAATPGSVVTLEAVGLSGVEFFAETQTLSFGPAYTIDIGGCSYEAIDVEVIYDGITTEVETYTVLPELSFSFLVRFADSVGSTDYVPVRIYVP